MTTAGCVAPHFRIFFNSASFELILFNTLSISLYELIAGFPMPILLALIFHYTPLAGVKKTVQMVSYAPHFITVVVNGKIDQEWDDYLKRLNDMGLERVLEIYQTGADRWAGE